MYDVAVIGGGIIGTMITRELSRYRLDVCLVERENDIAMGATRANSAIVHAGFDAKEGSLKAKMNVRGSILMEGVCRELGVSYIRNGSLVIGFTDEDRETVQKLYDRGIKNGVKELQILDKAGVKAIEPNLSNNVTSALYAPTGGIVCPYELAIAAMGNAMDNGASLLCSFEVAALAHEGDAYTLTAKDGRQIEARYVINAAGLYSDKIAKLAGDDSFEVHPRRGEYIVLDREQGGIVKNTIFRTPSKMGKGILVTPTVHGNLLLGPTSVDMVDKEDKSTTEEGLALVMREAGENIEGGLPFSASITSFCGLRAVGNTGDFIINLRDGFLNVAAIESPGLTSAPAIAEYVAGLLRDDGLTLEAKSDFDPTRKPAYRFRHMSIEEKNEIIKKDPSFGRIICRCETVTEGEILEAIRTNPPASDIDGVKRRTRAGMGRCQGGFCGTYVMELIAKERGVPMETVTKFGGGSYMVASKTK